MALLTICVSSRELPVKSSFLGQSCLGAKKKQVGTTGRKFILNGLEIGHLVVAFLCVCILDKNAGALFFGGCSRVNCLKQKMHTNLLLFVGAVSGLSVC
jgi:hypothetical protein